MRTGAGLIIYAFMPGYLILSILFNNTDTKIGHLELVALSIPISIAVSTIISLIMSNLDAGLHSGTQILSLGIFNGVLLILAISISQVTLGSTAAPAMILMTLVFIFGVYYSTSSRPLEEKHTHASMYVLHADGIGAGNGIQLSTDEVFEVNIGVEDTTGDPGTLTVMSNVFPDRIVEAAKDPKSILSYEISFPDPGHYKLEWFLMNGEKRIRSVYLWISVGQE